MGLMIGMRLDIQLYILNFEFLSLPKIIKLNYLALFMAEEKIKKLTATQIRTNERKARVKELILEKKSIEEIAQDLELTPNTIVNYIGRLLKDESSLDVQYIKDSVVGYKDIVKSFEKNGMEKIGPIYSDLGGNVEYADITLVKVLMGSK
jgi:hypothetical protein